jgi:alpha-tubulin suppressor-like RCC1 family protein
MAREKCAEGLTMKSLFIQWGQRCVWALLAAALLAACGAGNNEVAKLPDPSPASGPQRLIAAKVYAYKADPAATTTTWSWGDGTPDVVGNSAQKVWNKAGSFTATFSSTLNGKIDSISKGFAVAGEPVSAGFSHTCAISNGGTVSCWGSNALGQLGNNTTTNSTTPSAIGSLTNVVALSSGADHTCALQASGNVSCWGANTSGQLGSSSNVLPNSLVPVAVPNLTDAVAIAAGEAHTCALNSKGTMSCWGLNTDGQLGNGTTTASIGPVAVAGLSNVVAISAGADANTCVLLADGTVRCWGSNSNGRIGNGDTSGTTFLTPQTVTGVVNAVALTSGHGHTCALLADGSVSCWGNNVYGQVGDSVSLGGGRPTAAVVPSVSNAVAVAAGGSYTCALATSGTVSCWGSNSRGQLGNGSKTDSVNAVAVSNLTNAVALTAGGIFGGKLGHTCALKTDGTINCWGGNDSGQIGDGTVAEASAPTSVVGGAVFWK